MRLDQTAVKATLAARGSTGGAASPAESISAPTAEEQVQSDGTQTQPKESRIHLHSGGEGVVAMATGD